MHHRRIYDIQSIVFFQKNTFRESVVECFQIMLRIDEYRSTFVETDGVTRLGWHDVVERILNV